MSEPWTPGPWTDHADGYLRGGDGSVVLAEGWDWKAKPADARLIQEAPEMAALLAEYHELHPRVEARDLLARIRGEAP